MKCFKTVIIGLLFAQCLLFSSCSTKPVKAIEEESTQAQTQISKATEEPISDEAYEKADNTLFNEVEKDKTDANYYVLPYSDVYYLSEADLSCLTKKELRIARNEIYARHGRSFDSEDLQIYFNNQPWYDPTIPANQFNESIFNEIEKSNIYFISEYEKADAQQPKIPTSGQQNTNNSPNSENTRYAKSVVATDKQEAPRAIEAAKATEAPKINNKYAMKDDNGLIKQSAEKVLESFLRNDFDSALLYMRVEKRILINIDERKLFTEYSNIIASGFKMEEITTGIASRVEYGIEGIRMIDSNNAIGTFIIRSGVSKQQVSFDATIVKEDYMWKVDWEAFFIGIHQIIN